MMTTSHSNTRRAKFLHELQLVLDNGVFHRVAGKVLRLINDLDTLAECAYLVGQREYGGLYYRARYCRKITAILKKKNLSRTELNDFYRRQRMGRGEIAKLGKFGETIDAVEDAMVDSQLRLTSNDILAAAFRQNGSAGMYLEHISFELKSDPTLSAAQIHAKWCSEHGSIKANLDIIKPSDWWAFSHPKWRKREDFDGSIPGEIYANALYYFAPKNGIAADAMAGSGMLKRVYNDRKLWQKDSDFNLKIRLYDLNPKRKDIKKHDARYPLPEKVDWLFIDPPYFGQSSHLFSSALSETQDPNAYLQLIGNIITAMAASLNPTGRLCVLLPKWSGVLDSPNFDMPRTVANVAEQNCLVWIDTAYVSRGRQQEPGSAMKNISAKVNRRMRSDTCVLNVFEKRA